MHPLDAVEDQHPREIEEEHRHGVGLPAHLLVGSDAAQPIDQPLEPAEHAIQTARPALVDAGHVCAEGLGEGEEDDQVEDELKNSVRRHEKSSGFSKASTRYTRRPNDTTPPMM